jgi:hypothetical protein
MTRFHKQSSDRHRAIARYLDVTLARIEVHGITPSFSARIHEALVEARARDFILWAKLTLDDLSPNNSERRNLYNIGNFAPRTL